MFTVDWKPAAEFPNYPKAFLNTRLVAKEISDFIKSNQLKNVHW